MSLLNLGEKDEYGKQKRLEHRGKYLRASRTGGVSLRAQTKAAGLNLTANSRHGFRVSRTVGKNTQMAMQNGRFVLRGRYGNGPTRLNLSKTGMTVSSRNALGSFNWVKPNRSSAKVFGVQVRGRNAAYAHAAYAAITAVALIIQAVVVVALTLARWAWQGLQIMGRLLMATPYGVEVLKRRYRNRQIQSRLAQLGPAETQALEAWTDAKLVAAIALVFVAWGRGRDARAELPWLNQAINTSPLFASLVVSAPHFGEVAGALSQWHRLEVAMDEPLPILTHVAAIGQAASSRLDPQRLPEVLFAVDELMLRQGPKTRLQEAMLAVFSDFAGLRLEAGEALDGAPETVADGRPSAGVEG